MKMNKRKDNKAIRRLLQAFTTTAIMALLVACQGTPTEGKLPTPAINIKVSNPILKEITEWDDFTGRFQPVEAVNIRSRVSGYLQEIRFKDGQRVNKGDTLFVIDQRPFKIIVERAKAQHELATKELKRAENLRQSKAISQEDLDRRIQEFRVSKATLDQAVLDLEFTEVKSPIDGRASRDFVNVGNLVTGGAINATLLTTVVSIDPIHFYFEAGERELLKYIRLDKSGEREGSRTANNKVLVQLQDEQEYLHEGHMDFVDNRLDSGTGTIQGRVLFSNEDEVITPGMFGRARLIGRENFEALLIPDEAINTDQSRKFVYVVNKENIVEMKVIDQGRLHNKRLRVINAGLSPNDNIIVKGLQKIRPGMRVNPVFESLEINSEDSGEA